MHYPRQRVSRPIYRTNLTRLPPDKDSGVSGPGVTNALLLREPLPCKLSAESARQPLIRALKSYLPQSPSSLEECF